MRLATRFAAPSLLLLWLAGCGLSRRLATARHTPCQASEVVVLEHERIGKDERWSARCPQGDYECQALALENGVLYRCRRLPSTEPR